MRVSILASLGIFGLLACVSGPPPSQDPPEEAAALEARRLPPRPVGPRCERDRDCVPDACCHAAACVLATRAPFCGGIMCTMMCEAGTMDCGQGHCACVEHRCAAVYE